MTLKLGGEDEGENAVGGEQTGSQGENLSQKSVGVVARHGTLRIGCQKRLCGWLKIRRVGNDGMEKRSGTNSGTGKEFKGRMEDGDARAKGGDRNVFRGLADGIVVDVNGGQRRRRKSLRKHESKYSRSRSDVEHACSVGRGRSPRSEQAGIEPHLHGTRRLENGKLFETEVVVGHGVNCSFLPRGRDRGSARERLWYCVRNHRSSSRNSRKGLLQRHGQGTCPCACRS